MLARVEVDICGRWDAVALSGCLVAYRSHLVEVTRGTWCVHAETPGYHGEALPDALSAIVNCLRARRVEEAVVRIDLRPFGRHAGLGPPS